MDPDIVRQQEEAERAAAGLPPRRAAHSPAGVVQRRQQVPSFEGPVILGFDAAETKFDTAKTKIDVPVEEPTAAPPREAINPNRRPLPPIGSGRRPGEAPPKPRRVRGLMRLLLYAIGGAFLGGTVGFVAATYFSLFQDQTEFFIASMAGGFALLFGLTHLLHYDH